MFDTGQLYSVPGAGDPAKEAIWRAAETSAQRLCTAQCSEATEGVLSEQAGGNVPASIKGRVHVTPSEGGAGFRRPTRMLLCEKEEHRVTCLPSSGRLKPAHKNTSILILSFLHFPPSEPLGKPHLEYAQFFKC